MILVRDKDNKYIGTIRKNTLVRYLRRQNAPSEYYTAKPFQDFYRTESFIFQKLPRMKKKASLELKRVGGQHVFHERDCEGCPICEET